MQIRTQTPTLLLDAKGRLTTPSYATSDLFIYNRDCIKGALFLKEWEFYQVSNSMWCMQLTYGHTSYANSVGFSLIELATGRRHDIPFIKVLPKERFELKFRPNENHTLEYYADKFSMKISVNEQFRRLECKSQGAIKCDVDLVLPNSGDAMCIATPMGGKKFYYNYKKNFVGLSGHVVVDGLQYNIDEETFALVDSGRGCWPYRHTWHWGSATTNIGGHIVGFNIGWGFGDTAYATENMLFVDGVAHKLDQISAVHSNVDYMLDWVFSSSDGRFEMTFTPTYDNYTETNMVLIHNRCHQVFGRYNGKAVMDDGTEIYFNNVCGFCEHAINRW